MNLNISFLFVSRRVNYSRRWISFQTHYHSLFCNSINEKLSSPMQFLNNDENTTAIWNCLTKNRKYNAKFNFCLIIDCLPFFPTYFHWATEHSPRKKRTISFKIRFAYASRLSRKCRGLKSHTTILFLEIKRHVKRLRNGIKDVKRVVYMR